MTAPIEHFHGIPIYLRAGKRGNEFQFGNECFASLREARADILSFLREQAEHRRQGVLGACAFRPPEYVIPTIECFDREGETSPSAEDLL